ncbi:MAG: carboxymuconolactone decarboxylase family protein [Nocardioidaceae bacterium]|nr:carboxymuconolactone decarboxylase family protein [Nocardioidaceae bacterium]
MTTTTDARHTRDDLVPGPPVRVAVDELAPRTNKAMGALDAASRATDLEPALCELVRARASQINGCAYCVDMHAADARAAGAPERTLHLLAVWRETPFFTARERVALELTEAITRLSEAPVGDEVFDRARAVFSEREVADLVWLIAVINTWNRLGATAHAWPLSG